MSDPISNCTLELACTVGSIDNALEALEEGADINFGGGAPLFAAIFNRNREVVRMLVERGAEISHLLPKSKQVGISGIDQLIDLLMTFAPPDPKAIDPTLMGEFNEILRKDGLGKPVEDGDWEGLVLYGEKLEKIGANQSLVAVNEVLDLLRPAWSFGTAALMASLKAEKKKIAAASKRYVEADEDIATLARIHLANVDSPTPAPVLPEPESADGDEEE
jgi:hypothetical protein